MSRHFLGFFKEPPPAPGGGGHSGGGARPDPDNAWAAEACRKNPGKWLLLARYATARGAEGAARSVKNGTGAWAGGGFEATRRGRELYVRYVGSG